MTDKSFINRASMSDKAVAEQIGAFIRHHRMEMNKTQDTLAAEAALRRFRFRLRTDRAQGAGIAVDQCGAVRRELCLSRAPPALALYGDHARGRQTDDRQIALRRRTLASVHAGRAMPVGLAPY